MRRKTLVAVVAVLGCLVIALPTALFFGLGDVLFGDVLFGEDAGSALFTVVSMAVGLALLWAAQFAWQSWRDRRRDS